MTSFVAASETAVRLVTMASLPISTATAPLGAANASSPPSLLPDSEPLSSARLNDAMSMLYELLSKERQLDVRSGEDRIAMDQDLRAKAMSDRLAALQRQTANEAGSGSGFFSSVGHFFEDVAGDFGRGRLDLAIQDAAKDAEAAWNSPAFWRDLEQGAMVVAKTALAVGSVAVTVATAGAAAPLLVATAIALSAGGLAISQTDCLDGALGNGASKWVGAGLEVTGAALNLGASASVVGTWGGSQAVSMVGAAANAAGGGMEVVAGVAQVRNGSFSAAAERGAADATQAGQRDGRLDRLVASLIESLQQSDKSHERLQASLALVMATDDQTAVTATTVTWKG